MTLYATDLDGTLLNPEAQLSDYSAKMYDQLSQQGKMITFITARTPATVEPILHRAHPQLPGVAMTGAAIWDPTQRKYLSVAYHKPHDVEIIARVCREMGVNPFVYTMAPGSNKLVVYHEAEMLSDIEKTFVDDRTLNDLKEFHLHTHAPVQSHQYTVLFFAMGTPERIQAATDEISRATGLFVAWYPDTYHPGLALLEVFASGVSKAQGLLSLKEMLRADKVVAFGDNLNDIPMLEAADVAVAVDNAHPQVKEKADIIIGPNSDDAVMKFILMDQQ